MSGNDREPIGRKGKPLPPRSSAGRGRRRDIEQDIDQDDFNDDEEEAPVPRKGKVENRRAANAVGWDG